MTFTSIKQGLKRCIEFLLKEEVRIESLVTDRNKDCLKIISILFWLICEKYKKLYLKVFISKLLKRNQLFFWLGGGRNFVTP